jgi:hypothetical protein
MRRRESTLEVHVQSSPRRAERPRLGRALAACLLLSAGFVGCSAGPEWTAVHDPKNRRSAAAIRAGQASVEALGREALDAIGYERIMEL